MMIRMHRDLLLLCSALLLLADCCSRAGAAAAGTAMDGAVDGRVGLPHSFTDNDSNNQIDYFLCFALRLTCATAAQPLCT